MSLEGPEHYLSKIERNASALPNAPQAVREGCLANIKWARQLAARVQHLDYDVRGAAIDQIHAVMDEDYQKMGFELPKQKGK